MRLFFLEFAQQDAAVHELRDDGSAHLYTTGECRGIWFLHRKFMVAIKDRELTEGSLQGYGVPQDLVDAFEAGLVRELRSLAGVEGQFWFVIGQPAAKFVTNVGMGMTVPDAVCVPLYDGMIDKSKVN
jgi:hypothetical protein